MKTKYITIFILLIFIVTGCPYESNFSLSNLGDTQIDTSLIGKWVTISQDNDTHDDSMIFDIYKFNDFEYFIEINYDYNKKFEKDRGFITNIGKNRILNIGAIDNKETFKSRYSFYKYKIKKDSLFVNFYGDSSSAINNFKSLEDFRNYFTKHLDKEIKLDTTDLVILVKRKR